MNECSCLEREKEKREKRKRCIIIDSMLKDQRKKERKMVNLKLICKLTKQNEVIIHELKERKKRRRRQLMEVRM